MNRLTSAFLAAAVLTAGFIPAAAMAGPQEDAQIKSLEASFASAVTAKDVDSIMKLYSPDVLVFDVVPPRQYAGAAAYRDDWKELFSQYAGPVKFEITDLVVFSEGTMGYSHSIQHLSGADPKGAPVHMTVRVTDVYRKQGDAWSIVHEHVSVPVDLATDKGDLASKP
jgi:ketosteroid isomerase-like protein